jgi:hypothetical protein
MLQFYLLIIVGFHLVLSQGCPDIAPVNAHCPNKAPIRAQCTILPIGKLAKTTGKLQKKKGRPLHFTTRLLIGCMQTLFLTLAAVIFGLDELVFLRTRYLPTQMHVVPILRFLFLTVHSALPLNNLFLLGR